MHARPDWWNHELVISPHVIERMQERGFAEVDLRMMLRDATGYRASTMPGRVCIDARWQSEQWEVVVEPDELERTLIVVAVDQVYEGRIGFYEFKFASDGLLDGAGQYECSAERRLLSMSRSRRGVPWQWGTISRSEDLSMPAGLAPGNYTVSIPMRIEVMRRGAPEVVLAVDASIASASRSLRLICSELCRLRFIESLLGPSAHRDSHSHWISFSGRRVRPGQA